MKILNSILIALLVTGTAAMAQDDSRKNRSRNHTHSDAYVALGLNNLLMGNKFPDATGEQFTVRPWGSWYVALGHSYRTRVAGPLLLDWGGEVSWMNYKFEDESTRMLNDNGMVEFIADNSTDRTNQKSKFTVAHLNLHFVPMLELGRHNRSLRIGAGVFGGYKIANYSKNVYMLENNIIKDRDHGNYFVNNIRYGVKGRIGYRDVDLFVNYDINKLFVDNRGPSVNPITVGLIFE